MHKVTLFVGGVLVAACAEGHVVEGEPGELICSSQEVTDPRGNVHLWKESYYPERMNAVLAADAELRSLLGTDTVVDCDRARAFSELRLARDESQPSLDEPEGAAADETVADEEPTVDKLWRGVLIDDRTALYVCSYSAKCCTAEAISPEHILLAAHCVASSSTQNYDIYDNWTSDSTLRFLGTFNEAVTYRHGSYTGPGNPQNDIALIHVGCNAAQCWNRSTSLLHRLHLGTVNSQSVLEVRGWGTNSQYDDAPPPELRDAYQNGHFQPDWTGTNHFLDNNDGQVNVCYGDSGGPARFAAGSGALAGVLSEFQPQQGKRCRVSDDSEQRWNRVSSKMSWIEARLDNEWTCPAGGDPCCRRVSNYAECW